jgi:spore germination protein KC
LARQGLKDIMDQFARNPDTRLRTDIFVVREGEGREALEINSPFNQFSAIAAVDQDRFCRIGDVALRDFFLDANRQGIRPVMPVVNISSKTQEKGKIFIIETVAVFNKDLEMTGILGREESLDSLWIRGILKDKFITESVDGSKYSLYESNLKSTIMTHIDHEKITVDVKLSGKGRLLESQSTTDFSKSGNLKEVNRKMNKLIKEQIEKTIKAVQGKYGQDIFGFGEELHREHPYQWKSLKDRWDRIFPTVKVTVDVDLHIMRVGNIGNPLNL